MSRVLWLAPGIAALFLWASSAAGAAFFFSTGNPDGLMATASRPDSAGAQFFVCASDQPQLDGQYTVFGRVIEGLEVVQQISAAETDAEGHPKTRIAIKTIAIRDTQIGRASCRERV